jgi:hypothetical protein
MFTRKPLESSTSSRNLFGGATTQSSTASTGLFAPKPANPFGGSSAPSTAPTTMMAPTMIAAGAAENIMYLSSNNPNRHAKLSTFGDAIKAGFYLIENKFENNERYMDAFNKGECVGFILPHS